MASESTAVYLLPNDVYKGDLLVLFGPLPTKNAPALKLHGPFTLRLPQSTYGTQEYPKPIYDYTKDQIVMLMSRGSWDDDKKIKYPFDILRFGKHLDLQSRDSMTRKYEKDPERIDFQITSAIIEAETGLLSLGVAEFVYRDEMDVMRTTIVQKRPDSQNPGADIWNEIRMVMPMKDSSDVYINRNSILVSSPQQSSNKTVYNLSVPFVESTTPDRLKKRIYLNTLPSNTFSQLHKDKTIVWRRYNIATEYEPWFGAQTLCPLLTYDQTSEKHRLYIFQLISNFEASNKFYSRIWVTQIDLRKDGSIPGFGEDIKPTACWSVIASERGSAKGLCVLQEKDSLFVSWSDSWNPVAKLLPFNYATGEIDKTKEWTNVPVEFEDKEKEKSISGAKISASGILVSNDFVED